jgi:8-oxo-dGTP diphosphatase
MTGIGSEIRRFYGSLPHFPDGRINFSGSDAATVMTVFVMHRGKLLLLKRSGKVANYKGKWHVVGGYIDSLEPIEDKAVGELREETGILEKDIASIDVKGVYTYTDGAIKKKWITQVVVVELKAVPEIRIDWEHTEYRWIFPDELESYDVIYNLPELMKKALGA